MADARLRGAWLGKMRFDDLSDTAWRVFTSALMWSTEQGTDGAIPARYVRFLHPDGEQPEAVEELVAAGLAKRVDDGLELIDWAGELGQSTAEQVEEYKRNARERQRKRRQRVASQSNEQGAGESPADESQAVRDDSAPRDVTANVTRDITRDVGPGPGKELKSIAPSRFCARHPEGTDSPCTPCKTARLAFEDSEKANARPSVPRPSMPDECSKHPGFPPDSHGPLGCDRCRAERQEAA